MWEMKQLKGGQARHLVQDLNCTERQECDDDEGIDDLNEEYAELELNEEEAPFLKGQTTKAGMCLSPIKISNIPDGSLQQAAMKQSLFSKDRKDIRELQTRANKQQQGQASGQRSKFSEKSLLGSPNNGSAQNQTNPDSQAVIGNQNSQMRVKENRNRLTSAVQFSRSRQLSLSMREQKESLPIFKLKGDLMHAIYENQVLVVIGETGSGKTT